MEYRVPSPLALMQGREDDPGLGSGLRLGGHWLASFTTRTRIISSGG